MNLASGCIFWPRFDRDEAAPGTPDALPAFGPLGRDARCEVAIIGGGITGALAAYEFTREGVPTLLLDRRPIAHGSTAASTGLLQYEIDTPLVELARRIGQGRAAAAYRASLAALEAFGPLVEALGDSCGLVPRPSLYLAAADRDVPTLREECAARQSLGIGVEFLDAAALAKRSSIRRPAALWSSRAFEVDPYRLTRRLIGRAARQGLAVFTPAPVTGYEPRGDGVVLRTAGGPAVTARRVIFATGYETAEALPAPLARRLCRLCRLRGTYALASEPLASSEGWPGRCLVWESGRPYFYLRGTEDGRAMFGGEDEDFADAERRDALIPAKAQALAGKFAALFPSIALTPACAWAGTFAESRDGLPYVGGVREFPPGWFALGYGGNGITFSLMAARILRDAYLGRANPEAALFALDR